MLEKIDSNILTRKEWNKFVRDIWDPTTDRIKDKFVNHDKQTQGLKEKLDAAQHRLETKDREIVALNERLESMDKVQSGLAAKLEAIQKEHKTGAYNIHQQLSGIQEDIKASTGRINVLEERTELLVNRANRKPESDGSEPNSDSNNLNHAELPAKTRKVTDAELIELKSQRKSQKEIASILGMATSTICERFKQIAKKQHEASKQASDIGQSNPSYSDSDKTHTENPS